MDPEFYGLPPAASTFAEDVDPLFEFLWIVCGFFFLLILAILAYSVVRYRRKRLEQPAASNVTHHTTLEIVWTLIPTVILMVVFAWGWKGNLKQSVAPPDALRYDVQAFQWGWSIYHPGAIRGSKDIWVPAGKPVQFVMTSPDVLHSMSIPAFRAKRDVVPGSRQILWFQATEDMVGESFRYYCTEYCGQGHSVMNGMVHVVSQAIYDTQPWAQVPEDPIEAGEYFYNTYGCSACHSSNGVAGSGPTFQNIWMREGKLSNGENYVADEAYIKNSVRNPDSQIVAGYPTGLMPKTWGDESGMPEADLDIIIGWMKSISEDN
ncbi:MAG: cytochrome c oxidase subunit II [Planctomycetota bacterium]